MRRSLITLVLSFFLTFVAALNFDNGQCECESPPCDGRFLNKDSLCECQFNAALFCWRRNSKTCPSPVPQGCGRVLPTSTEAAGSKSTFRAPYEAAGGLACVEIGYCSRPTRSKTTMVVTNANGTQTITVPVGLPTGAAAATPTPDPNQNAPSWPGADGSDSNAPSWPNSGGQSWPNDPAAPYYDPNLPTWPGANQPPAAQPAEQPPSWPNAGAPLQTVVPV